MKLYSYRELLTICEEIERATAGGDGPAWRKLHTKLSHQKVKLTLPVGEYFNPKISMFTKVWAAQGRTSLPYYSSSGRIAHQGIEPLVDVRTNMLDAIDVFRECLPYRCLIEDA